MAAVADGPLLVCHDGSEGAKHAIERAGAIWKTILEIADRRDAAMIAMGSRGLTGVRSMLLEASPAPSCITPTGLTLIIHRRSDDDAAAA